MTERQIRSFLRRRFSCAGWTLAVYYIIMNIMVVLPVMLECVGLMLENADAELYEAAASNAWGYLYTVLVGLIILTGWKGLPYWTREIWHRRGRMSVRTFAAALSVFVSLQLVFSLWSTLVESVLTPMGVDISSSVESASAQSTTVSMLLYSAIIAPVSEEILFRGLLCGSLRPYGKRFAIFGSALLFGLFHGNLVQTPYAFCAGLVLGYVAEEYGLVWSLALHVFNNFVLGELLPLLGDAVSGLTIIAFAVAAVIFLYLDRKKRQEYRLANPMDMRCVRCFLTCGGTLVTTLIFIVNMLTLLSN